MEHTAAGIGHARSCFRALNDLALDRRGSFYLTYGRTATREQILRAYPEMPSFLELKRRHDPRGVFSSEWYRWLESTIEGCL